MAASDTRRNTVIVVIIIAILLVLMLFLVRCPRQPSTPPNDSTRELMPTPAEPADAGQAGAASIVAPEAEERLTEATIAAPSSVDAGAAFAVDWTGPDNRGDYITIVRPDADAKDYGDYKETDKGNPLTLTAPIEPGSYEARYVTVRSRAILARAAVQVRAVGATVNAPPEAVAGAMIQVTWTGPNNAGDYITVVPRETPDGQFGHYEYTTKGSPVELLTPIEPGEVEVRYMTGQGGQVLARHTMKIVPATVTLSAPSEGAAGSEIDVTWVGPNNRGDYVTVVSKTTPDGQFGTYTYTSVGSPLKLKLPAETGDAEIRYMTGQGNKVLARMGIKILPRRQG